MTEGKRNQKKAESEVNTFSVPFAVGEIKENITINTNRNPKLSEDQLIKHAFKFHEQGNILEAAKYYQQFISQGFKNAIVFSNYGVILEGLDDPDKAIALYKKSIKLFPQSHQAYCNLGNVMRSKGMLQDAEFLQRKAIELNPNFAEAYSNLGTILKELGKLEEAESFQRKAIKIKPNFAESHFNLGDLLKDKSPKDAIASYERAIKYKMDYDLCSAAIGEVLLLMGKHKEGLTKIRKSDGSILFDNNQSLFVKK